MVLLIVCIVCFHLLLIMCLHVLTLCFEMVCLHEL